MYGIDIVEVERIKNIVQKHPEFLPKVFTEEEIQRIQKRRTPYERIAGMYAAKEAVSKAIGTGIGKTTFHDIKLKYIEEVPHAEVKGEKYYLSISHEKNYAIAVAIYGDKKIEIEEEILKKFKKRNPYSHKGDFGKIAIIAGSLGMTGSAFLSTKAALKMGAGLVYNIVPEEILNIMSIKYVEPIAKSFEKLDDLKNFLQEIDVLAVGPGMGLDERAVQIFKTALSVDKKIIVDADGLNIMSKNLEILQRRKEYTTVLTPHEGEFARLIDTEVSEIRKNRIKLSTEFAKKYKVVLLLKGHQTVITDGEKIHINQTGNPGMATAGSGDVLTGMISTLLKTQTTFDSALTGAYIHGLCGDLAAKRKSMTTIIARDLIEELDIVFKNIEKLL